MSTTPNTVTKYSISTHDGEFFLCRDREDIGVLFIGPRATLAQAREMVAALNSRDAVGEMLAAAQALTAAKQIASSYPQTDINVELVAQLIAANFAAKPPTRLERDTATLRLALTELLRTGDEPRDATMGQFAEWQAAVGVARSILG